MSLNHTDFSESIAQALYVELDGADLDAIRIANRIRRLSQALEQALGDALSTTGISVVGDYDLLSLLFRQGPTRPSSAAELLQVTQAGITGRVQRLGRAGLMERSPDPDDARSALIMLTDRGDAAIRQGFGHAHNLYLDLFRSLNKSDRAMLSTLLRTTLEASAAS